MNEVDSDQPPPVLLATSWMNFACKPAVQIKAVQIFKPFFKTLPAENEISEHTPRLN